MSSLMNIPGKRYRMAENFLFFGTIIYFSIYILQGIINSSGVLESGDGIMHYQFSKFSWDHPELLLDHWGKPLFTLLSSPFAQFGFTGMVVFNLLLFAITAISLRDIARYFNARVGWLAPILLLSAPEYYKMVCAGMTEVLFGALLAVAAALFFRKKYVSGSIVISFILFSRSEGMAVVPFFAIALIWFRQYKTIPFLFTGFILYGLVGLFIFKDFFWYINNNPYPEEEPAYESGKLWHFYDHKFAIYGIINVGLSMIGMAFLIFQVIKKRSEVKNFYLLLLLLLIPSVVIFAVHSYYWWSGLRGSLGLLRVMATTVPSIVAVALLGVAGILYFLKKLKIPKLFYLLPLYLGCVLYYNKVQQIVRFPIEQDEIQNMLQNAAIWFKNYEKDGKLLYYSPYFAYKADVDPFKKDRLINRGWINKKQPSATTGLEKGDLLMWDAHFAANEGKISWDNITSDPGLKLVYQIEPKQEIIVLGGYKYKIAFFEVQ